MKNIFENIPTDLSDEVFENLAASDHVKIERIISQGHSSPESGWYDQEHNEWVMVLKGSAKLSFNNQPSVMLNKGDYLTIDAHQKHKVDWTDPEGETVWLAVHF